MQNLDENITDRNKIDEYQNIKMVSDNTLEGLFFYLGIPDTKNKLINLLVSKRKENA